MPHISFSWRHVAMGFVVKCSRKTFHCINTHTWLCCSTAMFLNAASTVGTTQHSFYIHMEYSFQVNYHNPTVKSRAATLIFSDHHDTAKMNMWHGLPYNHVVGPFTFAENAIMGNINLSILKNVFFPTNWSHWERRRRRRGGGAVVAFQHTAIHYTNWILHKNVLPLGQMHIHMQKSHGTNNFRIAEQITTNHMILCLKIVSPLNLLFFMDPLFPVTNLIFSIT